MEKDIELYEKLSRLQFLLQKLQFKVHTIVGPMADTSRGQGRILAFLKLKDGISTKDLSYLLGIRISSLNELLAKLEKNGYITREPAETDKRVILIRLTQKGREEEPSQNDRIDIFRCLSADEQDLFGQYLDRVINELETELGPIHDHHKMEDWLEHMKEKMGEEQFEELMTMHNEHHRFHWHNLGRGHHGFGPHHGFGKFRHHQQDESSCKHGPAAYSAESSTDKEEE